jgi:hypothetical protein
LERESPERPDAERPERPRRVIRRRSTIHRSSALSWNARLLAKEKAESFHDASFDLADAAHRPPPKGGREVSECGGHEPDAPSCLLSVCLSCLPPCCRPARSFLSAQRGATAAARLGKNDVGKFLERKISSHQLNTRQKIMTGPPSLFSAPCPDNFREIPSAGLSLSRTGDGAALESWASVRLGPAGVEPTKKEKEKPACLANLDKPSRLPSATLD